MPAEPKHVTAVRTVQLRVSPGLNAGKGPSLEAPAAEWEKAVAFYADFCLDHTEAVERQPGAQKLLTWVESKTVATAAHPGPARDFGATVERNPAWTSRACPRCSHLGERFSPDGRGYPSRFRCGRCGWTGDANVVAALNLKRKWDRTFRYPTAEERAAESSRRRKAGAVANREGSPETVGANARSADAPAA